MSKTIKKLVIAFLIILLLNNFALNNFVNAAEGGNVVEAFFDKVSGSVIGLFTNIPKTVALGLARAMYKLTASVAYCETPDKISDSDSDLATISPFDILFNNVQVVNIDFFEITNEDTIVMTIRRGIAGWYYTMRLLASIILLAVLVYIGIRMAISTIASDRALYQKMLLDWVVSVVLIFLLSYIIIFVIKINSALVESIRGAIVKNMDVGVTNSINLAIEELGRVATEPRLSALAATFVYLLLSWQTLGLLISYFYRMLKLAFLLIIAPLITLTYSIDKIGDGKAQALNRWLKEFTFTILIQPFHCIIYAVLVDTAFKLLVKSSGDINRSLGAGIIAIICIKFVREAEDVIRKIFSFEDNNKATSLAAGATAAVLGVKYAAGIGKTAGMFAGKTVNFAMNIPRNFSQAVADIGANAYAIGTALRSNGKTFDERKDDYYEMQDNKAAAKEQEKIEAAKQKELDKAQSSAEVDAIKKKYTAKATKMNKAVSEEAKKLMLEEGLSRNRAMAKARKNVRKKQNKDDFAMRHKNIVGFCGSVKGAYVYTTNSALFKGTTKVIGNMASAGVSLLTASGAVANGGNFITGLGAGIAGFKTTNSVFDTFLQNTGGNLANTTKNNFVALGATDDTKIMEIVNRVLANSADYDDDDKLKELVDIVKDELKNAGFSEKMASDLKNRLSKNAINGEPINPDVLLKGLAGTGNEHRITDNLLNAVRKLSNFENEKCIHQALQTSENLGKSSASYMADIRFHTTKSDYKKAQQFQFDVGDNLAADARSKMVDTTSMNVTDKRRLLNDIDRAIKSSEESYASQKALDVESTELKREINTLKMNAFKIKKELKREYERNAREIKDQIDAFTRDMSIAEARAKAKLVLNKDDFMREIEREANKREQEIITKKGELASLITDAEKNAKKTEIRDAKNSLKIFRANSAMVADEISDYQ